MREAGKKRLVKLMLKVDYALDTDGRKASDSAEFIADYLLDNGIIVPPCKVGDKVYVLGDEYFWEVEVVGYSILTNKWSGVAYEAVQYVYKGEELIHTIYADKWGKEMFPTKAEAEYALKNRRSVSLVDGHIEE